MRIFKSSFMVIGLVALCPVFAQNMGISGASEDLSSLSAKVSQLQTQFQVVQSLSSQVNSMQKTIDKLDAKVQLLSLQLSAKNDASDQAISKRPELKKTAKTSTTSLKAQSAYQSAVSLMNDQQYTAAIEGFEDYLKYYPLDQDIAGANYNLGELYLIKGQPDQAVVYFKKVLSNPKSEETPHALYQLGMIFQTNGDQQHAQDMLTRLVQNYPDTVLAVQAKDRLDKMGK